MNKVKSVPKDQYAADLDEALSEAGVGMYNMKYCAVLALMLVAANVESLGYSYVLPAAICDLDMSDSQRGFISSIPFIGVVVTSFPWGYLVDTKGRKKVVIYAALAAGGFSMLSAFMPNLIGFAICKALSALCLACPAALPYTFIGEIIPKEQRDLFLSITNAVLMSGTGLVPLVSWGILSFEFEADFGIYNFRPWRLLTIVFACFFIVAAFLLSFGPESPKYLVSQNRHDEALKALQSIYAGNKGRSPDEYPVKRLIAPQNDEQKGSFFNSLKVQSIPLFKPPYAKWLALNGFLLFGTFLSLNGLYMWVPDILNRVLMGDSEGKTACQVILDRFNQGDAEEIQCNDTIDRMTFVINSVANISCAVIAIVISSTVKFIGKKVILISVFFVIGTFCILNNFITEDLVFAVLLSSILLLGLALGPITAYIVEIFPTHLRGMAVSLAIMIGRSASIIGTNIVGILLNVACEATFYSFGGLLLVCGLMTLLLPKSKSPPEN